MADLTCELPPAERLDLRHGPRLMLTATQTALHAIPMKYLHAVSLSVLFVLSIASPYAASDCAGHGAMVVQKAMMPEPMQHHVSASADSAAPVTAARAAAHRSNNCCAKDCKQCFMGACMAIPLPTTLATHARPTSGGIVEFIPLFAPKPFQNTPFRPPIFS